MKIMHDVINPILQTTIIINTENKTILTILVENRKTLFRH